MLLVLKVAFFLFAFYANSTVVSAQAKITGTADCRKGTTVNGSQIRPPTRYQSHDFETGQDECTWVKPFRLVGIEVKEETRTIFSEITLNFAGNGRNVYRERGRSVGILANGDKYRIRWLQDTSMGSHEPDRVRGKWYFTGGTGVLRGIEGQGTYEKEIGADGTTRLTWQGEYQILRIRQSAMPP